MKRYDTLAARRTGLAIVVRSLNRYRTPISVGVMVLGLVLIVLGPARLAIGSTRLVASGVQTRFEGNYSSDITGDQAVAQIDRKPVPFTIIPDRPRRKVLGYTVKSGDTIFGIANRFGLKPETLLWSNKDILQDNVDLLLPGASLAILPVDGVYTTADGTRSLQRIVEDNGGNVEMVISSRYNQLNGYKPDDVPPWGMRIVIPGGHRAIVSWAPPITTVTIREKNGTSRVITGFMQGMPGSCSAGIGGAGGTGQWLLPIQPGNCTITQPFAPWHSGIDIAANTGEPVRAADTGVVIFSGWNDFGYGDLIVLDHGNGWTTYYAHLNSRSVGCGQTVQRGAIIGAVGATGNATGSHLHFEMRWFNTPDNPASSIGF